MRLILFLILFTYCASLSLNAQCDYTISKYGVRAVKNVFVGTDLDFQNNPKDLFLDIYYPVGSTEAKRPMVMWVFGGGFFQGTRQDLDQVCTEFATKGFVAVTIDYRIGFHSTPGGQNPLSFDKAEIKRVGYRGMQDGKAMLRFMKARHVEDSIDLDRIWVGGFSAGSFVSLATAFLDKESDKPQEAGKIGDIGTVQRNDLGPADGNLVKNGFDTKVQGVFNVFGGLLDTLQIEKNDNIALISYHQTDDPIVACGAKPPYWPYPVVPTNYPTAFGTCSIVQRLMNIDYPKNQYKTWIYTGANHAVHDNAAVLGFMLTNANPFLCNTPVNTNIHKKETVLIKQNPVFSDIEFTTTMDAQNYTILDLSGKIISSGRVDHNSINVSSLNSGFYLLKVNEQLVKFVKE
jgi:hypothetical protein